jgi:carbon storage regulator
LLVIRRRAGETIVIGDDIEVTVIEISPTRVKLAVCAPRAISVLRKETIAIAADNRRAAEVVRAGGLDAVLRIIGRHSPHPDELKLFSGNADKD